ncbi:hypothetical protein MRX96_037515 [Rhipicephalus microplus]
MTTAQKKLVRSKSGLRIVTVGHEELSPFHLDEPPWTPDRETADCWRCRSKFDFITRRHHCRRCGRVYCSSCCSLQRRCGRTTSTTGTCACSSLARPFLVTVVPDAGAALPHCCRLSPDHRILEIENVQSKELIEIPLASISTYRILRPNSPGMTNSSTRCGKQPIIASRVMHGVLLTSDGGLSGVMIGYRPHGVAPGAGEEQQDTTMELAQTLLHLGLSPAPEAAAQGALWIVALNKAFRMIHSPDVSPE